MILTREQIIKIIRESLLQQEEEQDGPLYVDFIDDETRIQIDGTIDVGPIIDALIKAASGK